MSSWFDEYTTPRPFASGVTYSTSKSPGVSNRAFPPAAGTP